MKFEFYPIENGPKPGDFVWIENYIDMEPGERFLAQVCVNCGLPENIVARGIANGKKWPYTPFEFPLNAYAGQKRHLFFFIPMPEEGKNVWRAVFNPHN